MRHALGDTDAVAFEGNHFVRVVGQQPDGSETELPQHFRSRQIDPLVGVEPQLLVGVERVETSILQPIGPQLVDEPDAPSFLREIEQHAAAGPGDGSDPAAQLVAAVAAQAGEQVAGKTFRMQPHQNRRGRIGRADQDRQMLEAAIAWAKCY